MKGVTVLKGNPQNLNRRELSNAMLQEACSNYTRRIMSNTRSTRRLALIKGGRAKQQEVLQAYKLRKERQKRIAAGRGWFRMLARKVFGRVA